MKLESIQKVKFMAIVMVYIDVMQRFLKTCTLENSDEMNIRYDDGANKT